MRTMTAMQIVKQENQTDHKMKATLTFDLKHDQHAFDCAVNAVKYFDMIDEFRQHLRSLEKYQDLTEEQYNLVGKMREWLHAELLHAGIADKF